MRNIRRLTLALLASSLALTLTALGLQSHAAPSTGHATGSFEVKMQPLTAADPAAGGAVATMSLEKQFHGDLEATSKGAMLATGSAEGDGAYVALEVVTGKLKGRDGSFVLQHTGIATKGSAPQLNIIVVPHSGTGELSTLTGKLNIVIAGGKHSYDFEYSLAD